LPETEEQVVDRFEDRTDEDLLKATRRDPEAFGAFYRRHEQAMLVYYLRHTDSAEVAADLTAETFAAALGSSRRFKPGKTPAVAWLYGIAKNKLAASRARGRVQEGARRRISAEPLVLTDEAMERVEELADAARQTEVMRDLLGRLPPDQAEAVRSRVLEERDYGEIAERLECSQAVVRQRVSRALHSLRRDLQGREQS
jgi:RNA polymerase sigma factor (sigma-70 family)